MGSLSEAEIEYQKAHIQQNRQLGIAVSNGICLGLAFIAVLLRITARRLAHTRIGVDDWWAWISLVISPLHFNCISQLIDGRSVIRSISSATVQTYILVWGGMSY